MWKGKLVMKDVNCEEELKADSPHKLKQYRRMDINQTKPKER